jgi:hypothetical protein
MAKAMALEARRDAKSVLRSMVSLPDWLGLQRLTLINVASPPKNGSGLTFRD